MTVEEEVEALRAVVREAHEAIQDLNRAIRQGRKVVIDIEEAAGGDVAQRINEAVRIGLESYSETIRVATEQATDAVYERFDTISKMLLGEDRAARRKHGASLPELAESLAKLREEER